MRILPDIGFVFPGINWSNEVERDGYTKAMIMSFDVISKLSGKIFWNDEYEEAFWGNPPWRSDAAFSNMLIPVIYANLARVMEGVQISNSADCRPALKTLSLPGSAEDLTPMTLRLANEAVKAKECIFWCFYERFATEGNREATFTSACSRHSTSMSVIQTKDNSWDDLLVSECEKWRPTCFKDADAVQMLIGSFTRDHIKKSGGITSLYKEVRVSKSIINYLDENPRARREILSAIARRVCLSSQAASLDGSLQDEEIDAKTKERRMRTTQHCRIHYYILGSGIIYFEKYFGKSEHDKGL